MQYRFSSTDKKCTIYLFPVVRLKQFVSHTVSYFLPVQKSFPPQLILSTMQRRKTAPIRLSYYCSVGKESGERIYTQ